MFRAASFNNWRRAAFAAVSIASATAFVATSTARHPQHHPPELPSFRPGAVSCQPSAQPTTAWKVEESDSFHYELMHIPPRATESSHIIFGQIMRNGCIEKYDVYKRVNHNLNDDSPELVVADIQLGSKLDVSAKVLRFLESVVKAFSSSSFTYRVMKVWFMVAL
jgi:hypothetical protein